MRVVTNWNRLPGRLRSLHPWTCSKPNWMQPWATQAVFEAGSSSWTCSQHGCWTRQPPEAPSRLSYCMSLKELLWGCSLRKTSHKKHDLISTAATANKGSPFSCFSLGSICHNGVLRSNIWLKICLKICCACCQCTKTSFSFTVSNGNCSSVRCYFKGGSTLQEKEHAGLVFFPCTNTTATSSLFLHWNRITLSWVGFFFCLHLFLTSLKAS